MLSSLSPLPPYLCIEYTMFYLNLYLYLNAEEVTKIWIDFGVILIEFTRFIDYGKEMLFIKLLRFHVFVLYWSNAIILRCMYINNNQIAFIEIFKQCEFRKYKAQWNDNGIYLFTINLPGMTRLHKHWWYDDMLLFIDVTQSNKEKFYWDFFYLK